MLLRYVLFVRDAYPGYYVHALVVCYLLRVGSPSYIVTSMICYSLGFVITIATLRHRKGVVLNNLYGAVSSKPRRVYRC